MKVTQEMVDALDNWMLGENANHWIHIDGLSIRATHSEMDEDECFHIAPNDGWCIEIYPVEDWPFIPELGGRDIHRWEPDDAHAARRCILALMFAVANVEAIDD